MVVFNGNKMFSRVKELEEVEVSLIDGFHVIELDVDYGNLNDEYSYFEFRYIASISRKRSIKVKHAYSFKAVDSRILKVPTKELADFFASLILRSFNTSNRQEDLIKYDTNYMRRFVLRVMLSYKTKRQDDPKHGFN